MQRLCQQQQQQQQQHHQFGWQGLFEMQLGLAACQNWLDWQVAALSLQWMLVPAERLIVASRLAEVAAQQAQQCLKVSVVADAARVAAAAADVAAAAAASPEMLVADAHWTDAVAFHGTSDDAATVNPVAAGVDAADRHLRPVQTAWQGQQCLASHCLACRLSCAARTMHAAASDRTAAFVPLQLAHQAWPWLADAAEDAAGDAVP